jgi:hypothetical protein
VQQANAFMPTKLACPQEWIIKAIDRKLAQYAAENRKEFSETIASNMH